MKQEIPMDDDQDKSGDASSSVKKKTNGSAVSAAANIRVDYLELPINSSHDEKEYRGVKLQNGLTAWLIAEPGLSSIEDDNTSTCKKSPIHYEVIKSESSIKGDIENAEPLAKKIKMEAIANEASLDASDSDSSDHDEQQCPRCLNDTRRSNAEQKMTECRLFVNVGSSSDPPEVPGMAHFLQNMLVAGSKERSQSFVEFTSSCGGWINAFTESEKTTFKFAVPNDHLRSVLDRFINLFVSPLAKSDAIINARQFMNLQEGLTSDGLYRELCEFRTRHYRAHNMTFAMEASLPLDIMEKHFKECFHRLPHEPLPVRCFKNFSAADLINISKNQRIYRIDAIDGVPKIQFIWTIPPACELSKSKPLEYVSWLLEHRGSGSLMNRLQRTNYCQDVTSGIAKTPGGSQFVLSLNLTKKKNSDKLCHHIIKIVYSYLNMMRLGPQERIFDEIRKIEEIKLRFANEKRSVDLLDLCKNMSFKTPADNTVRSDHSVAYDPVSIQACMDAMTPDCGNIIIYDHSSKEGSMNVEPWFKTRYTETEITNDLIDAWKNARPKTSFRFPQPNVFLADDFKLIPTSGESPPHPVKIHSDRFSEVWYKPNRKSRDPKSYVSCYLISPLPASLPENAAMLDILAMTLENLLLQELYPAKVAGLDYRIYASDKGLIVKIHGFSQKLPLLLKAIMKRIVTLLDLLTFGLFLDMQQKCLDGYCDTISTNRHKLVEDVQRSIVRLVHWTTANKYEAISKMYDEFRRFVQHFFGRIFVLSLVQGNTTQTEAIDAIRDLVDTLKCKPLLPNTMPWLRIINIPRGTHCCRVTNSSSECYSIVGNFYQLDGSSTTLATNIELLNMIMADDSSEELVEGTRLCPLAGPLGVYGYSLTVDTCDGRTVDKIDEAIEAIRRSLDKTVRNLPRKKLLDLSKVLMNQKLKQHTNSNVEQDVERNWTEIVSGSYMFDRLGREIEVLRWIDTEELRAAILNLTGNENTLRKLSVQVIGINDSEQADRPHSTDTGGDEDDSSACEDNLKRPTVRPLQYVTHLPNEKKRSSCYFIVDIDSYKADLIISPVESSVLKRDGEIQRCTASV